MELDLRTMPWTVKNDVLIGKSNRLKQNGNIIKVWKIPDLYSIEPLF